MGSYLVIFTIEEDRPLKVPLLIIGGFLVLMWLMSVGFKIRLNLGLRNLRKFEIKEWTPLAQARGFEVDAKGKNVVMRGTVAGRPFELDSGNFFGYGMDAENALRFRVDDAEANITVMGSSPGNTFGDLLPPVGDEEFDKLHRWRANAAGARWTERFGPEARRLLVDFPELDVDQMKGEVRIRMPYRIDLAHLDAACRLVEIAWGPTSDATSRA